MKTLSPSTVSPSRMKGILPFGASRGSARSKRNGSPDIFSWVMVFSTNGLGSGRPNSGPKP